MPGYLGTGPNGGAAYAPGRGRTLTWSVDLSAAVSYGDVDANSGLDFFQAGSQSGWATYIAGVNLQGIVPIPANRANSGAIVLNATIGNPSTTVQSVYAVPGDQPDGPYSTELPDYSYTASGTCTCHLPVLEVFEVVIQSGGLKDRTNDGPYAANVIWYEMLQNSATATVSGSVTVSYTIHNEDGTTSSGTAPLSASNSYVVPASGIFAVPVYPPGGAYRSDLTAGASAFSTAGAASTSSSAAVTGTLTDNYGNTFTFGMAQSLSGSGFSTDLSGGASASATSTPGNATAGGSATLTQYAPRQAHLIGRIRAWNEAHPVSPIPITYTVLQQIDGVGTVNVTSGAVDRTDTQQVWSYSLTGGNNGIATSFQSNSINQMQHDLTSNKFPAQASLQGPWLLSNNEEDGRDTRCLFNGKAYNSFTVQHLPSLAVEPASSLTGYAAGSNTTLSLVGGHVNAAVAGGTGSLTRAFSSSDPYTVQSNPANLSEYTQEWEAYRYLQIVIQSVNVSNQPFRLVVTSPYGPLGQTTVKYWDLQTGTAGTNTTVTVDLCLPGSTTGTTGNQNSRFPLPTNDGQFWGVSQVSSISLQNLANGETYILGGFTLVRQHFTKMDFLPARLTPTDVPKPTDPQAHVDYTPGSFPNVVRMLLGITDWRQSAEENYVWHYVANDTSGNAYDQYIQRTLNQLIADLSAHPGWSVSNLNPAPADGYHDNTLPAAYAWGGGAIYQGGATPWLEGLDVDVTGSVTVQAQALWDQVDWYWACGDVWENAGTYDSTAPAIPLRFNKILRSRAYGVVGNFDDTPASGVTVSTTETVSGVNSGTGVTDTTGGYETGDPFGRTPPPLAVWPPPPGGQNYHIDHTASLGGLTIQDEWFPRQRQRLCFRELPTTLISPSNLETTTVRYFRVDTTGSQVWFHRAGYWKKPFYLQTAVAIPPTGSTDGEPRVQVIPDDNTIHVLFTRTTGGSGAVYEVQSVDGQNWSTPVSVFASGKHPVIARGVTGAILRGAYVGGNIQITVKLPWQSGTQGPYTALAAADDTFQIVQAPWAPYRWYLHVNTGSGTARYTSTDYGQHWTLLAGGGFAGGTHPWVAVGPGGSILWSAVVSNTLQGQVQLPGQDGVQSAFTFKSGGVNMSVSNDSFALEQAPWASDAWILAVVLNGATMTTDWQSNDSGQTWVQL